MIIISNLSRSKSHIVVRYLDKYVYQVILLLKINQKGYYVHINGIQETMNV